MPRRESSSPAVLDAGRWRGLMESCGFAENRRTLHALFEAYAEKHRHYHTASHIAACLALLDAHLEYARRPHEIELALWFHDAVYQPLSSENERKSAEWAARFLEENGAAPELCRSVSGLIMATRHDTEAQTPEAALLLDIDLSILGVDEQAYWAYEAAIRQEYRMVPMRIYRKKRVEVLKGFLRRPAIYLTAAFRVGREDRARANLARAISRLAV